MLFPKAIKKLLLNFKKFQVLHLIKHLDIKVKVGAEVEVILQSKKKDIINL